MTDKITSIDKHKKPQDKPPEQEPIDLRKWAEDAQQVFRSAKNNWPLWPPAQFVGVAKEGWLKAAQRTLVCVQVVDRIASELRVAGQLAADAMGQPLRSEVLELDFLPKPPRPTMPLAKLLNFVANKRAWLRHDEDAYQLALSIGMVHTCAKRLEAGDPEAEDDCPVCKFLAWRETQYFESEPTAAPKEG